MRKAVVIHHTLNSPGGESTVAIETIECLYELGYEVELLTVQPPDLDSISKSYGKISASFQTELFWCLSKAVDYAFINGF